MLINARSVKKPNAVFHLSADLAAQPIDWCFVMESWLKSHIDDFFISIPNYNLVRCDRSAKNWKKNHGVGVCSYVRNNFLCTQSYPQDKEQLEVLWLEIDVMSLCAFIWVVYYAPLCDYVKDLCGYLIQAQEHLCLAKNYWQFIMCGEFKDFCTDNVLAESNLTQINFEPTHNKKSSPQIFSFLPMEYIDSSNRYSDYFNRPRFSNMFFADSQEWKKSVLFQRATWKMPPKVKQTSSWCEL